METEVVDNPKNSHDLEGDPEDFKELEGFEDINHIFLDLDETVIHSITNYDYGNITPESKLLLEKYFDMPIIFDNYFFVYTRPHLEEFLKFLVNKNYKISVWTAADKNYATFIIKNILLYLEPKLQLQYIFFGYHCTISQKFYKQHKKLDLLVNEFQLKDICLKSTVLIDDRTDLRDNNIKNITSFSLNFLYEESDENGSDANGINNINGPKNHNKNKKNKENKIHEEIESKLKKVRGDTQLVVLTEKLMEIREKTKSKKD